MEMKLNQLGKKNLESQMFSEFQLFWDSQIEGSRSYLDGKTLMELIDDARSRYASLTESDAYTLRRAYSLFRMSFYGAYHPWSATLPAGSDLSRLHTQADGRLRQIEETLFGLDFGLVTAPSSHRKAITDARIADRYRALSEADRQLLALCSTGASVLVKQQCRDLQARLAD